MELFNKLFHKGVQKGTDESQPQSLQEGDQNNQDGSNNEENQEEVTVGTKVKVVAALAVVGFAAYVAYWIQEPVELRTDVLGSTSMESQMKSNTQEVSIVNFAFDPATLSVEKGTVVVWTNKDTVPHNVVGEKFTSPTLNSGESFSYTFHEDGTFSYRCTFHPQMKATVMVGNPALTQADVLAGFGAGASLALEDSTAAGTTMETSTMETAAEPTEVAPPETLTPPEPENIYTTIASAPGSTDAMHSAALQSLSESLGTINTLATSAQGRVPLYPTTGPQMGAQESQPQVQNKGKLASSGPEDILYVAMFGIVLYLNRKKLRRVSKQF